QLAIDLTRGRLWVTERDGNRIARFDLATETWQEYDLSTAGGAREPWGLALDTAGNVWFAETAVDQIGKLDAASGIVTEYGPLAAGSQPWGVALDAAGNVWFTERAGNKIGRYGPQDAVIEYSLPTPGSQPTDVVVDGQGCAWYAAPGSNRIGRVCRTYTYLPLVSR
ncbi:MAG: hypothetical protein P8129_25995, partial [Anaerolineae bacterium]